MYAKWIGDDFYVGPKHKRKLTIKNGEVRKIHAKGDDGKYILEGMDGGYLGWIEPEKIEVLECQEKN